jgi:TolB-like protein
MALIDELKRRKVFKVGGAYLVVAWLAVQAVSIGFPAFDAPPWALRVFILVAMLGFPIALLFAWMFDRTPGGIRAETGGARATIGVYVAAAALAGLALGWYFKGQPSYRAGDIPAGTGPSVAVLPFANMSSKADEEYFSDGMTEELLNVLAKIPKLNVAARTSVFEFKGKGGDVREIGRKLGVSHIVEGSIRRDGEQVRVTAQLIRVADGFHLWSERYDRELKGVFALQDDIARQIGEQLQLKLGVGELPAARAAIDPAAYDEYLKGRKLYRERKDMPQAIAHLRAAVARAPDFAAGWASLSLAHECAYWSTTPEQRAAIGDSYGQMIEAAQRAEALDPHASMTLHAVGNVARGQGRFADAERTYVQAMQVDPGYADVREDYTELLASSGYFVEAEASARKLLKLDPLVMIFWWRLEHLGLVSRRLDLVDEAAAGTLELSPSAVRGRLSRYLYHVQGGDIEAARADLVAAERAAPDVTGNIRLLFDWATHDPAADDAAARRSIAGQAGLWTYAALRPDAALFLDIFENEAARHIRYALFSALGEPVAYPLFKDPRSKDALKRYGFVAYWREKGWPALCRPLGSDDFECGSEGAGK